jgi:hypothetical protein
MMVSKEVFEKDITCRVKDIVACLQGDRIVGDEFVILIECLKGMKMHA